MKTGIRGIAAVLAASALLGTACGTEKEAAESPGSGGGGGMPATIELVSIQDLSGPGGPFGISARQGMELAIAEINESGFLGDTKLSLDVRDTGSDPTQGAKLMTEVASSRAIVAFGSVSSNVAVTEAPVAQQAKLPVVFTQAGSPGIVDQGEYIYRATPPQRSYMHWASRYMEDEGIKTLAIIYDSDIPTNVEQATEVLPELAEEHGLEIIATEATTSKQTDVSGVVSKVIDKKPDAIAVMAAGTHNVTILKQIGQANFKGQIQVGSGAANNLLAQVGDAAEGTIFAAPFNARAGGGNVSKFVSAYEAEHGELPTSFSAEGYDAVWFVAHALKATGDATREGVLKGLQQVAEEGFEGALGTVKFKDRDMVAPGLLVMWQDGKEMPVEGYGS